MKTFSTIAIASLALAGLMPAVVYGQDDDVRSRGLVVQYQNGTIDGIQVSILKKSGTGRVPVDPGTTFKEGDQIWVSFASNFEGYVYIVNVMPDGQKRVLFPYQTYQTGADSQASNLLHADQRYILPKGDAFAFDEHAGTETVKGSENHAEDRTCLCYFGHDAVARALYHTRSRPGDAHLGVRRW